MRPIITLLVCILGVSANAQIVDIPDPNFKNALVNLNCADFDGDGIYDDDVDTNDDGEIQVSEAAAPLRLSVSLSNISSLVGIAAFTQITHLQCGDNPLTTLDLRQNPSLEFVNCWDSQISTLLTANPNLVNLNCDNNQLTTLDLSQNPNLEILGAQDNQLVSLDVSNNAALRSLNVSFNELVELDLSQNPNIAGLVVEWNDLESLNLKSGNTLGIVNMISNDNPFLLCVDVDDPLADFPECVPQVMQGWCLDPWTEFSDQCNLGVAQQALSEIKIWPNPTNDFLHISTNDVLVSVRLFSVSGQLLKTIEGNIVPTKELSSGMYLMVVETAEATLAKKVLIQ